MKAAKKVTRRSPFAVDIVPGVRQNADGTLYRIGFDRAGRQSQVPYRPKEPVSAFPFDLRPVGGHLWQAAGQPVRCMAGCGVCRNSKARVVRERIAA